MLDLQQFNLMRVNMANFLSTPLFSGAVFDLDLWHLVHFISGILIFLIILKVFKKQKTYTKFAILFILLVLYEIFEWFFYRNSNNIFKPESFSNVFGDIIFAFFGGYLSKFSNLY